MPKSERPITEQRRNLNIFVFGLQSHAENRMSGSANRTKKRPDIECPDFKRPNSNYSQRPKTGCPDFGIFESCLVPKRPDFRCWSEIRTILSGYRTSGWIQFVCPVIARPVQTSEIRTILSGFRMFGQLYRPKPVWTSGQNSIGRPITGHKCPDFDFNCPNIRNPDNIVRLSDNWIQLDVQ